MHATQRISISRCEAGLFGPEGGRIALLASAGAQRLRHLLRENSLDTVRFVAGQQDRPTVVREERAARPARWAAMGTPDTRLTEWRYIVASSLPGASVFQSLYYEFRE